MFIDPYQFQHATIRQIIHEAPEAVSVQLTVPAGYTFHAGQYTVVRVCINDTRLIRQYSFSSAPASHESWLTITQTPNGAVSGWFIKTAKPGDTLEISPPFTGEITQKNTQGTICMIAGGSGIAPLMSIVRSNRLKQYPSPLHLLYSTRSINRCFKEELTPRSHETIHVHLSDEVGHLALNDIQSITDQVQSVFVCGSRPFSQNTRSLCLTANPKLTITTEAFTL